MSVYQRRDLLQAALLVATSHAEYDNIRDFGIRRPVAVIPNGVGLVAERASEFRLPLSDERLRTVLFLGRIHPVKGLLNLVRAWARIPKAGWQLLIAGPDEGGHLRDVLAEIDRLRMGDSIHRLPEVDGVEKTRLLRRADILVLPSFTENFGVVVAEALAQGVPAIATRGTPWSDLVRHGCGWWIEGGIEPLASALRDAMIIKDEERLEMGRRGMLYVRRFDWTSIAQQMIEVYSWVLGRGARPDCVQAA